MELEIFKDIPGYNGLYQVSNIGNVKSLMRNVKHYTGTDRFIKERILKPSIEKAGYYFVSLANDGGNKGYKIHQLVAMAFLNHIPNGHKLVVNHKNFNKLDNRVENLEIVTQRENANKRHVNSSSKFIGVSWSSEKNKWASNISIKENDIHKNKFLGYFKNELDASNAYQEALKKIINGF